MNEITAASTEMASWGVMAVLAIVALIVWFFINRASVKANQQIQLLQAMLEEQKKQNALLLRLTKSVEVKKEPENDSESEGEKDFTRLIPER